MPQGGDNHHTTFEAAPNVVARLVGDETVIVNLDTEEYFSLNPSGAIVWSHLVEGNPAHSAAASLTNQYSIGDREAAADVEELMSALLTSGLLVPAGQ